MSQNENVMTKNKIQSCKKVIVTTTIYEPTQATLEFCERKDWYFIIVGDQKTPHESYRLLEKKYKNVIYLSPELQEQKYKTLSDAIGWKCIMRRNIGFVEAYNMGAEVVATVDDDNIPYSNWGKDIYIGSEIDVDIYETGDLVFDPLSVTKDNYLWHRGFPIDLLRTKNNIVYKGKVRRKVLVQADLWDGDPDIDAIARLTHKPLIKYDSIREPYCSNKIGPFNSQNTFLAREVIPYYSVFPFIGRMDDIWGSYVLQHYFPNSVIYNKSTVYQDRNPQDLITNLEKEVLGYRNSLKLVGDLENYESYLPKETLDYYKIYRKQFK
jgi:hypothetical protein